MQTCVAAVDHQHVLPLMYASQHPPAHQRACIELHDCAGTLCTTHKRAMLAMTENADLNHATTCIVQDVSRWISPGHLCASMVLSELLEGAARFLELALGLPVAFEELPPFTPAVWVAVTGPELPSTARRLLPSNCC